MTDSSSELEKGAVSSHTLPVPKSDDQADKSDTYSYLSDNVHQEHGTSDEHQSSVKHAQDKHYISIAKEHSVQDKDGISQECSDQQEYDIGKKKSFLTKDSIQEQGTGGKSEFVNPLETSSHEWHSEPTSYTQCDFVITADWLGKAIKNPLITVKAAPILLCITGLPNSNLSIFTNHLLDQFQYGTFKFSKSIEQGIHFYETSAVRIPGDPRKTLTYSKSSQYSTVIESAIKHHLYVKGNVIRKIEFPAFNPNVFKDKALDSHFESMIDAFYKSSHKPTNNPIWNQGLPSGIALINMWEIGHSKAAAYILPLLSGYLHNSYIWMLFDIMCDLPSLYKPPAGNEIKGRIESQPHLHYLLRFSKLAASKKDSKRTKVCKLISYHEGLETVDEQQEKVKQFEMDVEFLATQMGVNKLIDIDNTHMLNSDQKNLKVIKKAFDDIVNNSLDKPVEIPLSYIFLRSLYYNNEMYISKKDLKTKAKYLELNDNNVSEFCLLFTSFGSIIDISLIDPSSDTIILQPVKFFHEVDKLFHPKANIDPLLSKYGIVTEQIASFIFRDVATVIMESLVSFGIAAKLSSKQVNYTLPAPNGVVYYIPYASKSPRDYKCQPTALRLLRDVNRPMSHSKVAFVSTFLNHSNSNSASLELPDTPVGNITKFKVTSSNGSKVVFEFAYLPDAFEFRFQPPYNQKHEEIQEISKNIIVVCNDIMQIDTKYNFAVMCSADPDPKLTTRLKRKHHLLPNRMICLECKSKGLHNYDLIEIWNQLLINEEKCKVPETKKLNGEPLTVEDACSVVKGLEKLSEETLHVAAQHLNMEDFLTTAKRIKWRKCMTMILDWEDKSLLSEDEELKREASKKVLAIKLMNAANEIYTMNKKESRDLENVAKSLNFEVANDMKLDKERK